MLPILKLLFISKRKLNVKKFPASILPVALNTNCSVLTLDNTISEQCTSAVIYRKNGEILESLTPEISKEKIKWRRVWKG